MKYMYWQFGKTPLHEASCYGRVDVIGLLLEKEANVNAVDNVSKHMIAN